MNEEQLISSVKQVFAEKKSKYYNTNEMERRLVEKGLTPKEAMQALSLARTKQEVGMAYPRIDGVDRELHYELLTEEDRKTENRLLSAVRKVFDKKGEYCKVDEMKQQLLEERLTPDEVKQAISLAEANQVIQRCFPYTHEIDGEPSFELVSEEQIKMEEQEDLEALERDFQTKKKKTKTPRKREGEPV